MHLLGCSVVDDLLEYDGFISIIISIIIVLDQQTNIKEGFLKKK